MGVAQVTAWQMEVLIHHLHMSARHQGFLDALQLWTDPVPELQVVMGWLRLGQYVRLVPLPVTSGFMSGIGLIILSCQVLAILGTQPAASAVVRPNTT